MCEQHIFFLFFDEDTMGGCLPLFAVTYNVLCLSSVLWPSGVPESFENRNPVSGLGLGENCCDFAFVALNEFGQPEPQSIALPGGLVGIASSSQTTWEGGALASSPSGCATRGELCPDGDSLGLGGWVRATPRFVCLCCLPLGCLPNLGSENLDLSPFPTSLLVLCLHSLLEFRLALCAGRSLHCAARWVSVWVGDEKYGNWLRMKMCLLATFSRFSEKTRDRFCDIRHEARS